MSRGAFTISPVDTRSPVPSHPAAGFAPPLEALFPAPLPRPVQAAFERILALDRLYALYDSARRAGCSRSLYDHLLELLGVRAEASPRDLERIPRTGPVVAVSNHPFGLLEGPILGSLLPSVRPDVRILANSLLGAMPEIARHCILVNPFGGPAAARANLRAVREAIAWLDAGHMLVVFPAGEVAHVDPRTWSVADPPWNPAAARLLERTGATAVPFYFSGANSALFQLLGLAHPRVRTALLPHEFLNKRHSAVELRIGHAIPPARQREFPTPESLTGALRERVYLLARRDGPRPRLTVRWRAKPLPPVAPPADPAALAGDIAALPPDRCLAAHGDLAVYLGLSRELPAVLAEIGRLREISFREAGEGSGLARDLDAFDDYYEHLFVWNCATREIAGAYRAGATPPILAARGVRGLYTASVFSYGRPFLDRLGPALELGRSFIRPEYRRSYAPLLLLWKGIGRLVASRPEARTLFGPVSISNDYQPASRRLMVDYLEASALAPELTRLVRPRHRFRPARIPAARPAGLEDLSACIADLEPDGKGVPVLLRQYLGLGARVVAFNVDRKFSNALDGLVVVDLTRTRPVTLERYMGRDAAREFLAFHARTSRGAA